MSQLSIEELPYRVDSAELLLKISHLENHAYLDSSAPYSSRGRYDILVADPELSLPAPKTGANGRQWLNELRRQIHQVTPPINNDYHLPFVGGALGYFAYDFGRNLEQISSLSQDYLALPAACIHIYSWAIIVDHRQKRSVLMAHPAASPGKLEQVKSLLRLPTDQLAAMKPRQTFTLDSPFQSNLDPVAYRQAFDRIQDYLLAGDCYQINLAQRFSAQYTGSPLGAYLTLRKTAAAPFSAYLDNGDHTLLSLSPERFIHVARQRVLTSPIKGTRPRGETPAQDRQLARELLDSEKDRAENLMIVDLLRNDLGKACLAGSIEVEELFELQSFDTVHHLVSTIAGQLKPDYDALKLLADCFPGGSITGAPKVRAMEIIEELEPHRRSAYCGSIGYISCDGQMDTNIAIRSLVCKNNRVHCWAGGGIVADSNWESEYQECLNKVGVLLAVLEKAEAER